MEFINPTQPVKVQLARNLVKAIKRGHAWVYAEALRSIPDVAPGTPAILLDNRGGREIARGYLDPNNPIALRICSTQPRELNSSWAAMAMQNAIQNRHALFAPFEKTNAYRLINGEGDGLPGLVCDIYDYAAVIVTDGLAPEMFWKVPQIATWLANSLNLNQVFHKTRSEKQSNTVQILGSDNHPIVMFKENGHTFTSNLVSGQKTGFFLDQRDNRALIQKIALQKTVLNVFGYTGGFSIYAAKGGAPHVTTVDLSLPALEDANLHWQYNQLPEKNHRSVGADAFEFLSKAVKAGENWDLVILDPPSFAPSESSIPQAEKAYLGLITLGAQATSPKGFLGAASCSSHITSAHFQQIVVEAISNSRRTARILSIQNQPADHPSPLAMPELRYLKFILMQLD